MDLEAFPQVNLRKTEGPTPKTRPVSVSFRAAGWLWGGLRFVGFGQCRGELVEGLLGRIALAAV